MPSIGNASRASHTTSGRGALLAGGLAAILASTCCLGPLVLLLLGFSGAWIGNLTALEPYRPMFVAAAVVAYAFSPIDLIPDVIPVLGYLDDLILVPLGIQIALRLIPPVVMAESRAQAQAVITAGKPVN